MTHQITVRYSDGVTRTMPVEDGQTVLDAAEGHGVPVVNECQSGVCGTCVGRCVEGRYALDHAPGLSAQEREQGRVLTCQTVPQTDIAIELDYPFAANAAHIVSGVTALTDVEQLSDNIVRIALDVSALPEPLTYKPGQFAQLRVPGTQAWRSYSFLTARQRDGQVEFLVRLQAEGTMSDYLRSRARIGDEIEFRGSKGDFHLREGASPVLLVAGGTGLSAILAMAEELAARKHPAPVRLLYGVTAQDDLVLAERLEALAARLPDFRWQGIVREPDGSWTGPAGLVTDLLDGEALTHGRMDTYLCGPAPMVDAVRDGLAARGHHDFELYFEKFLPSGRRQAKVSETYVAPDVARLREDGRGTALVIGGSIAGMAAAKALTARYDRVVIVEKDPVHHRTEGRPGAAQGWHLHHLLIAGQQELDAVFPGVIDDMVAEGAFRVDMGKQYRLLLAGAWKKPVESGIEIICAGRPLLEWCVRRRLDADPHIQYRYGHEVVDLLVDPAKAAVRGAVTRHDGRTESIAAEFVVDASGKNTPVPALLERHGFEAPEIEEDCINCFYSSMRHKVPPGRAWTDKVMRIAYAYRPDQRYYAAQYYMDTSRSTLCTSLVGYNCYDPPRNPEEFRAFARRMPTQAIGDELDDLEPCSEVYNFRYPEMRRYHYERVASLPSGLVALGDALSSADPVSGAGMTKALLELGVLRKLMVSRDPAESGFPQRFYRRVTPIVDRVWFVVREQNLRYPWIKDVEAKRPAYFRALTWYVDRVLEYMHGDAAMYRRYLAMTHFVASPAVLARPDVVARVLWCWARTKLAGHQTLIEKNFGPAGPAGGGLGLAGRDQPAE